MKALEQALAQERARKEVEMRAQADPAKREAIKTARRKVAQEKTKTEAETRAPEAAKARLQQHQEREAAPPHEQAEKRAAEATAVAIYGGYIYMEEAERKIRPETPPGGSRVDTLRSFFNGDAASGMKIDLDAEDSWRSVGSGSPPVPATRARGRPRKDCGGLPRCTPKTTTPSSPAAMGMDKTGASGRGEEDTPPSSTREGPPPPYCSRESTPGRPPPGSRPRWRDMDIDDDLGFGPDANSSGSRGPADGGPPGPRRGGPLGGLPRRGLPGGPPYRAPPERRTPAGPLGRNPPNKPPGADIPQDIWRWIVYLRRKIKNLVSEAQINKIKIGKSAAVAAKVQKDLDIAKF